MEALRDSIPKKLKTTTHAEQYTRQRISDQWRPNGSQRFVYNTWLQSQMPILGGPQDDYQGNPQRYEPIASTVEAEFPIKN